MENKRYRIISQNNNSTLVEEYIKTEKKKTSYETEDELEKKFIKLLQEQGYEYLKINNEDDLIINLRKQIEKLNNYKFSDEEWNWFFNNEIAKKDDFIIEKTKKIQDGDGQILLKTGKPLQDGSNFKNIKIIDKFDIHKNFLQVINQYEENNGNHKSRYDVTILVNGLPLIHIELKKRGVDLKEAFNQIERYQRDSFWSSKGLYNYVQLFVISNGTLTKYYSNTIRNNHIQKNKSQTFSSYEFTSFWSDIKNKRIEDLTDFTKTFFAKHSILNVLIKYCVFTVQEELKVMRPYQIAAVEKILNKIEIANNYKYFGSTKAGGYIWHTTGSGKTLTSFKAAKLIKNVDYIEKVLFVVDRQDLDYQTMREYDKFEKGAANSTKNTSELEKKLNSSDSNDKIIVTTIQKLNIFIKNNKNHKIFSKRIVLIFDECHRSQFGSFHNNIVKNFKNYSIFGFTGTPIFSENINSSNKTFWQTTEQAFGDKLHSYTIMDAISDNNVLKFKVDWVNTFKSTKNIKNTKINSINEPKVLMDPKRIENNVGYILEHFNQKTKRNTCYEIGNKKVDGFNSIFCVSSIEAAKKYYQEFKKQQESKKEKLKVVTIFSYAPNENISDTIDEEEQETTKLDKTSRDFLDSAIKDYNEYFETNFSTDGDGFQNYYKDVSKRMVDKTIDLLIVVNMFLTGFDAKTLNTLWVDKNLKFHGLLQAYSRTNRILNSIKTHGNIVCFRNLLDDTNEALALFGNENAESIVLLKTFEDYYDGYEENGNHIKGYSELIDELKTNFLNNNVDLKSEMDKKLFIKTYNSILRIKNILTSFDEFEGKEILTERNFQDCKSKYLYICEEFRNKNNGDSEIINDDIIFENELIKHDDIDVDYILRLIWKLAQEKQKNKKPIDLNDLKKIILSSSILRNKEDLIEDFCKKLNIELDLEWEGNVEFEWKKILKQKELQEREKIIKEEKLKKEEANSYFEKCLKNKEVSEFGDDISKILTGSILSNERNIRKNEVIKKIKNHVERFNDL